MQDQSGYRNALDDVGRGRALVIIGCPLEAAVISGDLVVEIAKAGQTPQARSIEDLGRKARFHPERAAKLPDEVILVETIARQMQLVGRSRQVHGWAHRRNCAELR